MVLALINHYCNGNKAQFANTIGVSPQAVSTWISRDTLDAERLFTYCEHVNAEWLLSNGNGPMIKENPNSDIAKVESSDLKEIIDLARQLGMQIKENEYLHEQNMKLTSENEKLKKDAGDKSNTYRFTTAAEP